uniref:Uncharacterized protein n=1 Tax=Anguilla anguilla TaxID=7936 RepID=A0A0E9SQE7_ANGAN
MSPWELLDRPHTCVRYGEIECNKSK